MHFGTCGCLVFCFVLWPRFWINMLLLVQSIAMFFYASIKRPWLLASFEFLSSIKYRFVLHCSWILMLVTIMLSVFVTRQPMVSFNFVHIFLIFWRFHIVLKWYVFSIMYIVDRELLYLVHELKRRHRRLHFWCIF